MLISISPVGGVTINQTLAIQITFTAFQGITQYRRGMTIIIADIHSFTVTVVFKEGRTGVDSFNRSAAAMTRRNILLAAKSELLDETFEAAKKQICDTDYGKYRELLVALLSCALLEQAKQEQNALEYGDEVTAFDTFEVLLNETDRARFGASVIEGARRVTERRIGAERAAKLRLSEECADIDGGLLLRYGDVETNCSLTVLLREMRRELEGKISAILFD